MTLAELEEAVEDWRRAFENAGTEVEYIAAASRLRADAWRAAFEWHRGLIESDTRLAGRDGSHLIDWAAIGREEEAGLRLIERLK